MAFDAGGGGGVPRQSSSGLPRASSSRGAAASSAQTYQGSGDSVWQATCSRVEEELRRLAALTVQLRKSVDAVGTARDSEDVRQKISTSMSKGKDILADIATLLKSKLQEAADDTSLSQKERTARRTQQQRFEKDWAAASTAYKEVLQQWQDKAKRNAAPPKGGAAGGKSQKAYPSIGSASSTTSKAEEEAA